MRKAFLVLTFALLSIYASGQGVVSGGSVTTGPALWEFFAGATGNGGPLTYPARTDLGVFGTGVTGELLPAGCSSQTGLAYAACLSNAYNSAASTGQQGAKLSYTGSPTQTPPAAGVTVSGTNINGLSSYLNGYNTVFTDPDFGTLMTRATDYQMNASVPCLGGGSMGVDWNMGSAGDAHLWAADISKLLIQNTASEQTILAFNASTGQVTPTDICGGYLPGSATFAWTNPHVLYGLNTDQENTVSYSASSGTFLTGETVSNGSASAVIEAVNPASSFAQFGVVTGTTSGNVWTGALSGATLTAVVNPPKLAANTPFANTLYMGVLCDGSSDPVEAICGTRNPWYGTGNACANVGNSTNPACWYMQWSLVFNFNYVPSAPDAVHFPAAQNNCLPQNYDANYNGVFQGSMDDTAFTIVFGDTGQASHTGQSGATAASCTGAIGPGAVGTSGSHTCTGPVWIGSYHKGLGCKALNSMTDEITGDFAPTGMALNGQANIIPGTVTGTPTPTHAWTQDITGATTQLNCLENSSGQCYPSAWTQALAGLIWGGTGVSCTGNGADATHVWRDSNSPSTNYLTPSGCPTNAPFYYPDVLHDLSQRANPAVAEPTLVQQGNMKVTGVSYNASTHQTTISYSNSVSYSWGQQFVFSALAGANDSYLNCTSANQCPIWTAVSGGQQSSGITITDFAGGSSNYSDTESQSGCGGHSQPPCPTMGPNGQAPLNGFYSLPGGFAGLQYWQTEGLVLNVDYQGTGHHASGYNYIFQGKYYTAFNQFNPTLPCTIGGTLNGLLYAGPDTPCPSNDNLNLLPTIVVDDQHGSYNCHGTTDVCAVPFTSTLVCGQAGSGVGDVPCETSFASIWDSEVIVIENAVTRSSPGNLVGADCNYGAGPVPCVYRVGHTFNTNDNWNFNGQNAIDNCSPDGNWCAFPTDDNKTLGCMDGTTNCWDSWTATQPNATGSSTAWSVDGSGNITITMPNQFCPTSGTQYWSPTSSMTCGSRAGIVTLSGFAFATWLNGSFTLGSNVSNAWCNTYPGTPCNTGTFTTFTGILTAGAGTYSSHWSSSGAESGGTQKATPPSCGVMVPCQREDIVIAHISTAHQ